MWKEVEKRESGKISACSFSSHVKSRRAASLQLSNAKDIVSPHKGSVNSLQVDSTEGRYLLSGASDASIAVFDAQKPQDYEGGGMMAKHRPVFVVDKQHPHGHKYAVSSAIWYPVDTGLFVTGSYDHLIKVWDTNTTQAVMNFKMPGKVYSTSMSSLATFHMLIAVGTEDVQVRLCDVASGAFSHTLSGHRVKMYLFGYFDSFFIEWFVVEDGVMTVQWSTSSEWVLLTGGCDGAIRFWDIRRAGCFRVLDQSHSQLGRRPPSLELSAVPKVSISRSSISGRNTSVKSSLSLRKSVNGNGSKHLSSGKVPAKGVKQRLHPGMVSSQDRATAHYGAVTGLRASEDGMYLFSAGSDSRLRLWDIESGCNTLVNFETVRLQASKPIQLSLAQESALVFIPCMTAVKILGATDIPQISSYFSSCFEFRCQCRGITHWEECCIGSLGRSPLGSWLWDYRQWMRNCGVFSSRESDEGAGDATGKPHLFQRQDMVTCFAIGNGKPTCSVLLIDLVDIQISILKA
ncbi:hypothetical protein MLD38_034509 [Melastoma candidum]|uniref:Uncharacterized protein n=1 Tax=Melastoma candidum TaxID=119954 RepID=A0ACB9M9W9_9MYRT|nr:hypothetical protein MLD38_034509 [Melastoma candidum]